MAQQLQHAHHVVVRILLGGRVHAPEEACTHQQRRDLFLVVAVAVAVVAVAEATRLWPYADANSAPTVVADVTWLIPDANDTFANMFVGFRHVWVLLTASAFVVLIAHKSVSR